MNTSTYYNLKLVEGTDIVNPLTTDVPNYETIDEQMHNNSIAGVTLATEVASGKVHALVRENNECAVIRFIATSNWALGDTITVDGIPVVALLPSGEALPDGAYVINANVLCILTGSNLTVYVERKKSENANEITFNDTTVAAKLVSLDAEIVRLDDKIDNVNLNDKFITLTGTTDVAVGNTDIGLPTGFTPNNCVIISAMFWLSDVSLIPFVYNSISYADAFINNSTNVIRIALRNSEATNKQFKIVLMRTDI